MPVWPACQLTEEGRDAADHLSEVFGDHGPLAARNEAREVYGWEPLGKGVSRVAFGAEDGEENEVFDPDYGGEGGKFVSDPGECVIKVGAPHSGQNEVEVKQYQKIAGERDDGLPWERLEPIVAPVQDWDPAEYRWLTMPKGDTESVTQGDASDLVRFAEKQGFFANDIHGSNVAQFGDEVRIIDLGHDFKWTGYTEPERWDAHIDRLEQMGCIDVYSEPRGRLFREVFWGSPLRLPGYPYGQKVNTAKYTKGATLERLEVYGTRIPKEVTTKSRLEDALRETLEVESAFDRLAPHVDVTTDSFIPRLDSGRVRNESIGISTVEEFLLEWYDAYDTTFAAIVPAEVNETVSADPPELQGGAEIIDEIEEEFESL